MPPTKTWKEKERQGADLLNPGAGRRTPLSGQNSGHHTSSDGIGLNGIYIEAKHRQKHTALSLLRETMKQAAKEKKIPVCQLTEHQMRGLAFIIHSHYLDDFLITECVNRCISPFLDHCVNCGSREFSEGAEQRTDKTENEDQSEYLVRRCAKCGQPIPYRLRTIDPMDDDQGRLFPRANRLPSFG